ncbi:MAG: hypothetical protein HC803_05580 [Saprospiraceae bacterium]|nr:hypothetical protein [Saprospiraceae bacterium]
MPKPSNIAKKLIWQQINKEQTEFQNATQDADFSKNKNQLSEGDLFLR